MYDLDGDSKISREELLAVLHMMVGTNISEEQVNISWKQLKILRTSAVGIYTITYICLGNLKSV